jgi:hypothetical protein
MYVRIDQSGYPDHRDSFLHRVKKEESLLEALLKSKYNSHNRKRLLSFGLIPTGFYAIALILFGLDFHAG